MQGNPRKKYVTETEETDNTPELTQPKKRVFSLKLM